MEPRTEWRNLLSRRADADDAASVVEMLEDFDDDALAQVMRGAVDNVFAVLIRDDDESVRAHLLEPLLPLLDRALQVTPDDALEGGLGLAACATLLASAGRRDEAASVLEPWVPRAAAGAAELTDEDRTSYALACGAHGFDDGLHAILHEPPVAYEPRQTFGPDARSFARYVAAAAEAAAPVDEFSAAFTSLVAYVPVRLETGGLRWTDLLFAGYASFRRIAGYEPGEVLDAIRKFVREVAGE